MTTSFYLEHYLDSLENLPTELQRNFSLMRDLDTRAQSLSQEVDKLADDYLRTMKKDSKEKRDKQMEKIKGLFNKIREYSDDKVQLGLQTYELVDKHIRRLDYDLSRFEHEIQGKALSSARAAKEEGAMLKKGRKRIKEKEKPSSEDEAKGGARKKQKKSTSASLVAAGATSAGGGQADAAISTADVLDMPVDPNEPTYCICQQVSYGEMIGCDNNECSIEWFHFSCVGLTTKPKGKWFCPKCIPEKKKK